MRLSILVLIAILVSACGRQVQTQVQAFGASPVPRAGERVFVAPPVVDGQATLEMREYVRLAQDQFRQRGYTVVGSPAEAELLAIIGLEIDAGRDVQRAYSIPQFGVTGYSGAQTFGTVTGFGGVGTYTGTTFFTPQYGITGYITGMETTRVFSRSGRMVVARSVSAGQPPIVYDVRVDSQGSCGMLAAIAPAIVEAMFATFPNGGTRTLNLPMPANAQC
jgi:hypothetical protein